MFTENDNDVTDEDAIAAMREVISQRPLAAPPPPPDSGAQDPGSDGSGSSPRTGKRRRSPVLLVVAAVVVAGALAVAGVSVLSGGDDPSPTTTTEPAPTTLPLAGAQVPANLLGRIGGTIDQDGEDVAFPGELVTAPRPRTGKAVAWQWELCPEPDSAPGECTTIGEATDATWASPPTPDPVFIRVAVTIELDGVRVQAVSETYTAMPEGTQTPATTEPPATEAPTTTAAPTTTVPRNAYGDEIGATITEGDSPEAVYALAAAARTSTSSAAGSNEVALLLEWVQLRTVGAEAGTVVATADGYKVTIGGTVLEFKAFTSAGDAVSDVTVCLEGGSCGAATAVVYLPPACTAGDDGCGTLVSRSGDTTAVHRGTVTGIGPGPELVFETLSERPVANVAFESAVRFANGWFVIVLPAQPPAGARQELAVTYSDAPEPDPMVIGY